MQNKNAAPTSWFVRKRENRSGGGKVRKFSNKYANGMIRSKFILPRPLN